ncbi:scaffolding protein [Cohnella lubricantis]|uniref:Scaffolding protein n=2 Tax=Cohnella lubricantis TaxID=2163172 RepID=A0A841T6I8_9BACL|nr:scaffolding protein [Cohnella lubricantis]
MPFGFLQMFAGDPPGGGGGGSDPVTFTEEQVKEREKAAATTAAEKAVKDRFGDLAGMDLKDLKRAVALMKKADEEAAAAASKSKSKGKDDEDALTMEDVEKRAKELLEASQKEQAEATFKRLLRAEVKVLANELGFADWEDAAALADLSKVKENDKGELEGVKEALQELLKKKPHLGKSKGNGSFGADVRGGGSHDDKKKSLEKFANLAKQEGTHAAAPNDPWASK